MLPQYKMKSPDWGRFDESSPSNSAPWPLGLLLRKQFGPGAGQGALNAQDGRDQDVDVAGFDFLNRAEIQVGQFREALLGDCPGGSLTANITSQPAEIVLLMDG